MAAGQAAGEEAEEDYGVCWSSLCGEKTYEREKIIRKRGEMTEKRKKKKQRRGVGQKYKK